MRDRLVWVLATLAALSVGARGAGVLSVDGASYDAGQILPGTIVVHAFLLTNTGDLAVTITDVATSCGCTTATLTTSTLGPGESVALEARFDSSQFAGQRVAKLVHVRYAGLTDPTVRQLDLTLSATVLRQEPYDLTIGEFSDLFFLLIDLRGPDEFALRHLQGALSVPFEQLSHWVGGLPQGVFAVLYDQDGTLAPSVVDGLHDAGYRDAQSLRGGLDAWTRAYGSRFTTIGAAAPERFLLPAVAASAAGPAAVRPVDPSYLKQEFLVLVDLRAPEEYAAAHVAGAANVQVHALSAWTASLPADVHLILYDHDGSMAREQAGALRDGGFTKVQALFGGLAAWRAAYGDRLLVALVD